MPEINIKVRDKCAKGEGVIICNNSDYTVVWDLDEEWTPYDTKTMRVNLADGTYQDVVFTGNTATLPVLTASGWVSVGLYAGDIHTSRAARLLALSSVLTPGGSPAAPAEDVYAQIMAKLNELSTVSPEDIAKAVEDYLAEHPAASASMRVEGGYIQFSGDGETWKNVIALADLKGPKGDTGDTGPQGPKGDTGPQGNPGKDGAGMDVTGATVDQTVKIAAVDDNGVPTAWEAVDMAGGGETWEVLQDVMITADESQQTPNVTYGISDDGVYSFSFDKDVIGNNFSVDGLRVFGIIKGKKVASIVLFRGNALQNKDVAAFRNFVQTAFRAIQFEVKKVGDRYYTDGFFGTQYAANGLTLPINYIINNYGFTGDFSKVLNSVPTAEPITKITLQSGSDTSIGLSGRLIFYRKRG